MSNRNLAEKLHPIATVNRTRAELVKSSVHATAGDARRHQTRLDSIYAVFPKMILGERNRHRALSLSDRSSRAVPPEKLIAEVRSGEGLAMPAKFRSRVKGMGGGDELTGDELMASQLEWIHMALDLADSAEQAMYGGEEKETVNRRLDMVVYMHSLQTATFNGWMNFFGLRLDPGASPTIVVLAQHCFEIYKAAEPVRMEPGTWHLPFVDGESFRLIKDSTWIDLSAARCAHLSYNDLETGQLMTVERALGIAAKLRELRHPSPFEHQATPDNLIPYDRTEPSQIISGDIRVVGANWENPEQHGNLPGWRQARKLLPGEAVAPLPARYEL